MLEARVRLGVEKASVKVKKSFDFQHVSTLEQCFIRSLSRFFNSIVVADLNEKNGIPTGKKYWKLE